MISKRIPHTSQRYAAAYIRESTEEQDKGFSPQNQERMIREYAQKNGFELTLVYKDLISGTSTSKRSEFTQMMSDAKQKKFNAILVYHTSRFARNVLDARTNKELLRAELGIDVISVTQHFGDWNDPTAFLNEGINELFDAYYSKQLSSWTRGGLLEKRKQGMQVGHPPLGYYKKELGRGPENRPIFDQKWLVHPEESKWVKQIFTLYASGRHSLATIAQALNKVGAKTKEGNSFTYSSIKSILRNRTYLGRVYSPRRGYPELPGLHKAIISEDLFSRVQAKIEERRGTFGRPTAQHRFYLLQGLVFCWSCRKWLEKQKSNSPHAKMLPKLYCETNTAHGRKFSYYGCKFKRETKNCTEPEAPTKSVDAQVLAFMEGIVLPDDIVNLVLQKLTELIEASHPSMNADEKAKQSLIQKRNRLNKMYLELGAISDQDYENGLSAIKNALAQFTPRAGSSRQNQAAFLKQTEKFLRDFKSLWKNSLPPEEQRAWIQMTIKRVWVHNKKVVAIEPHDDFKDLFHIQKKSSSDPH